MKTAIKLGKFRFGFVALTLTASSAVLASGEQLGTVFYSPAERASIVAQRSGITEEEEAVTTSYYNVSGIVKREGEKSAVWLNGKPVYENSQSTNAPQIRVTPNGVTIDGKPAKVGETLDATTGESSSELPPEAVQVIK